jgi:hypothetical protein
MGEFWSDFAAKLGDLAGKWASYTTLGSFLLYLVGYLTLRFQLSTYGVASNFDVFDEKYLFVGCRFLVYLVASVPNILILILLLAAVGYLPYRLVPAGLKLRFGKWILGWCDRPLHLPLLGIVLAVILIQFAMRRCFLFGNMLLRKQLPDDWLSFVLLSSDGIQSLYFSSLVAGTLLTFAIFVVVLRSQSPSNAATLFANVLGFLVAVEFLLLPVNYGVLISTKQLPRTADLGGNEKPGSDKLKEGERAWLVWDSKEALTYLVRTPDDNRTLVTLPAKESKIRIIASDDIFCVLFGSGHPDSRPCR